MIVNCKNSKINDWKRNKENNLLMYNQFFASFLKEDEEGDDILFSFLYKYIFVIKQTSVHIFRYKT